MKDHMLMAITGGLAARLKLAFEAPQFGVLDEPAKKALMLAALNAMLDIGAPDSAAEGSAPNFKRLVGWKAADVERELLLVTLEATGGNRTHAAEILGLSIRTLRNKLGEYKKAGIEVPAPPAPVPRLVIARHAAPSPGSKASGKK